MSNLAESRRSVGAPPIDTGIGESQRARIAEGLARLLADTYTVYLKTHNFHWNVTGPMFSTLHLMFQTQYTEFSKLASIAETSGQPNADSMIRLLVEGNEAVVRTARSLFPLVDEAHDEPTADLLTQRMQIHEKNAWMLRSLL